MGMTLSVSTTRGHRCVDRSGTRELLICCRRSIGAADVSRSRSLEAHPLRGLRQVVPTVSGDLPTQVAMQVTTATHRSGG